MLASLSRIEHQVKSARKTSSSSSSSSSSATSTSAAQAAAEAHLLMQQATARRTAATTTTAAAAAEETPPPSIHNPEHLRHSSKVSSIRKRLLDQKDKDIADLHAKNNAMQRAVASLDAVRHELAAEKKKTKTLQADLDRTRAEVIGQARAGEETAMTTTELRAEVSELEKKLSVANAANAAQERQILRLGGEVKNLEARNVDLASFSADTAETLKRSAEEEAGELRAHVDALERKLAATTSSLDTCNVQCQKLEAEAAHNVAHAEEMEAQMNRMRIDLDGSDDREAALKSTIGELEAELAAQHDVVEQAASREREASREMEAAQQDKEETRAWVVKSAKHLRERIVAVRQAGAGVKEEMRAQCASMSVDFAKLSESVVGAISELTGLKDDAVAQYRREQRSRQKVFNELQRRRGNIRVLCRSRPNQRLASKEKEEGAYGTATFTSDTELTVRAKNAKSKNARCYRNYEFDHVFHPSANQEEVYYEVSPMVQSAMDGFHSCIFAYGQTGSGKTYTMQGPPSDPGVYARSLEELFRVVDQRQQTHTYSMSVSMVEIYNETIRDLLLGKKGETWPSGEVNEISEANEDARKTSDRHAESDKKRGMSRERHSRKHGSGAPTSAAGSSGTRYGAGSGLAITRGEHGNEVVGATHLPVSCPGDIEHIMQRGQRNRSVGSTSMNEHSSRSHCLLIIEIAGVEVDKQMNIHGKLVMVDLAGSERLSKTEASGARLKEAQNINKSLSALGNVINALKTKVRVGSVLLYCCVLQTYKSSSEPRQYQTDSQTLPQLFLHKLC
jgi:predicted  nucleic acid-binding Zn-ribbon protein